MEEPLEEPLEELLEEPLVEPSVEPSVLIEEIVPLGFNVVGEAPRLDEVDVRAVVSDESEAPSPVLVSDGGGVKLAVKIPVRLPVAMALSPKFVGSSVGRLKYPPDANTAVTKLRNPIVSDRKKE